MIDIKKIREERGLTQSQLADALNNNKINLEKDKLKIQAKKKQQQSNSK